MAEPRRLLFASIGSLGDLHPVLALALAMRERGHVVSFASLGLYREKLERLGLPFHPLRPEVSPDDEALAKRVLNLRKGPEVLFRDLFMPALPLMYEDLRAAASGVDVIVAGEVVFAAPIVAEKLGLPWVSVLLQPATFFSRHDPSVLAPLGFTRWMAGRPNPLYDLVLRVVRGRLTRWGAPSNDLRRELGLAPHPRPLVTTKYSPDLNLALFSRHFAAPQPDWPPGVVQLGFVFHDQGTLAEGDRARLEDFLGQDGPVVAFTLGSSAVRLAGDFYAVSLEAARAVGARALLLVGANQVPEGERGRSLALAYAPYHLVFPRVRAVVHSGGVGTTAQALRAGRPQLIVPWAFDQPDNAARVRRLGAGLTLARREYRPRRVAATLRRLLGDRALASRAGEIGQRVAAEDALGRATQALEHLLGAAAKRPRPPRAPPAGEAPAPPDPPRIQRLTSPTPPAFFTPFSAWDLPQGPAGFLAS